MLPEAGTDNCVMNTAEGSTKDREGALPLTRVLCKREGLFFKMTRSVLHLHMLKGRDRKRVEVNARV